MADYKKRFEEWQKQAKDKFEEIDKQFGLKEKFEEGTKVIIDTAQKGAEVVTDVALGEGTIDRIAQRMDADIGVRVADQTLVVPDRHAAKHQPAPGLQHMDIESHADMGNEVGGHGALQSAQVLWIGQFDVVLGPRHDCHRLTQRFE